LIRSGKARETFLQRLKQDGVSKNHHYCSGRIEPVLDLIAAGEWVCARRVCELTPVDFQVGQEYEDDYCYARLIFNFIGAGAQDEDFAALVSRFSAALDGQPSARLALCQALADRDQAEWDEAFESLLAEQDMRIARAKSRGQIEEPEYMAERLVYIEGLAHLRIAGLLGLKTQANYRYCPASARAPALQPFPGE
jgi:hypothetical protein